MATWAEQQGVQHLTVLTDDDGRVVAIADVKAAIREIVELGSVEHLCLYFAGHGVNSNRNEVWLLTGAPEDPQEAINVSGSVKQAQYGSIPYVAVISDACRTAAAGLQMQGMSGSEVFPNDPGGAVRFVDQFYACGLGRPAHEVAVNGSYEAVYTAALLTALEGREPVQPSDPEYVRPRPLRDYVQRQLSDLSPQGVDQAPEAIIASDDDAWVATLPDGGRPARPGPTRGRRSHPAADAAFMLLGPRGTRRASVRGDREARARVDRDVAALVGPTLDDGEGDGGPELRHSVTSTFRFRGVTPTSAVTQPGARSMVFGSSAVVGHGARPSRTVLVTFETGMGVALPVLPRYDAVIDFDGEEVISVAYERWSSRDGGPGSLRQQRRHVREMRAVAAIASRDGRFTLEPEDAEFLAARMRVGKRFDPALAVYAAYAYDAVGRPDLVANMAWHVARDIGGLFFDIAMLCGPLRSDFSSRITTIGGFPLLGQGWALRRALDVTLPPALQGIEQAVVPSLWTLFDPNGCAQLADAISEGVL
jgi:hypothetical protein